MKRLGLIGLTGLLLLGGPSWAQTPPEGLVWLALRDINESYFNLDDPTNRPPLVTEAPEGMMRAVDLNHDSKPDWLMDYTYDGQGQFCGTGGCAMRLYVSYDDGYVRAFDNQAHEFAIVERGGETRVEVKVHHLYCPMTAEGCGRAWAWDADALRLVERPADEGGSVITLDYTAIDDSRENGVFRPPTAVAEERDRLSVTCAFPDASELAGRVALRKAETVSTPDLNGDGVRDWVLTPATPCDNAPTPGFYIWASAGESFVPAFVAPAGRFPKLDLSVTPARALSATGCSFDEVCAVEPLEWDADQAGFVPGAAFVPQPGGH